MCRLLAYCGPVIPLQRLLTDPEHSLLIQSWAPREMREAALNADGFGFGWYTDAGEPVTYTNVCPMWSDCNLAALGKSLRAGLWMANVRSATPGQDISHTNTQPFSDASLLFLHNGYIAEFRNGGRQAFHAHLSPAEQAEVHGHTDSEYLFALLRRHAGTARGDLGQALRDTIADVPALLGGRPALFNTVVTDARQMVACRHAFNTGECPSLYYAQDLPGLPDSIVVASEPFSTASQWQPVAAHTLLYIRANRLAAMSPL